MPYINGIDTTPADAVAQGRCPECGRDLAISSEVVETKLHWPRGLDPSVASPEAIERAALITAHFTATAAAPKA